MDENADVIELSGSSEQVNNIIQLSENCRQHRESRGGQMYHSRLYGLCPVIADTIAIKIIEMLLEEKRLQKDGVRKHLKHYWDGCSIEDSFDSAWHAIFKASQ